MLSDTDRATLAGAGITDINRLAAAAAALLPRHPIHRPRPVPNTLSEPEATVLREAGAHGVGTWSDDSAADTVAVIAGECAQMVLTALCQKDVAALLGVSTQLIRQKREAGEKRLGAGGGHP